MVLGNVGTGDDADVLTRALDDDEPLVREHAEWALQRMGGTTPAGDREALGVEAMPRHRA